MRGTHLHIGQIKFSPTSPAAREPMPPPLYQSSERLILYISSQVEGICSHPLVYLSPAAEVYITVGFPAHLILSITSHRLSFSYAWRMGWQVPPAWEGTIKAKHMLTNRTTESLIINKSWGKSARSGFLPYILSQCSKVSRSISIFIVSKSTLNR